VLEIHHAAVVIDPPSPTRPRFRTRDRPLTGFHPLILAVCRETRRFPAADPVELGPAMRCVALGSAEAFLVACELRQLSIGCAPALVEASRRLRELACCIEIARRLGYLGEAVAARLAALHARANRAVSAMAAELRTADGWPGG
jgi:hypothetical protein